MCKALCPVAYISRPACPLVTLQPTLRYSYCARSYNQYIFQQIHFVNVVALVLESFLFVFL
jgi:hypothetical protein